MYGLATVHFAHSVSGASENSLIREGKWCGGVEFLKQSHGHGTVEVNRKFHFSLMDRECVAGL